MKKQSHVRTVNIGTHRYKFQCLSREDLPSLVELERRCFTTPWTEKQFLVGLDQKAFYVFGFKKDSNLIAYISFYQAGKEMEILNIAVHPDFRRIGVGSRLLGLVLQISAKMGIKHGFLEVRPSNKAALKLYAKYHFQVAGKRPEYYVDTGEDAIIMKAEINK